MSGTGEHGPVEAAEILHKLGLSEETVRAHVIRAPHVEEAITGPERFAPGRVEEAPPSGRFYRLDVEGFGRDLHALLSPCVVGYSMQLRQHGRVLLSRQWGSSKTPVDVPKDGVSWTADVPMHVASVSKLITAMAMTKALADRGVSPDSFIADWLPRYWRIGHHANRITFRHLLRHTSGLDFGGDPGPSDFFFMQNQVAKGTTHLDEWSYKNMNFGLCRILISTLSGAVSTAAFFPHFGFNDAFWDVVTIRAYERYVSEHVFAPAGVSGATLDHPAPNALAYPFPVTGNGWNSDDLSTMSGGAGWHLSAGQLLDVMGAFRRSGTIVSQAQAQAMLENRFGLDSRFPKNTPLGRIYAKGGWWEHATGRQVEQSNAYFLPKGMELVVLANSPFCAAGQDFMDRVTEAIENNIRFSLLSLLTGIFRSVLDR